MARLSPGDFDRCVWVFCPERIWRIAPTKFATAGFPSINSATCFGRPPDELCFCTPQTMIFRAKVKTMLASSYLDWLIYIYNIIKSGYDDVYYELRRFRIK